MIGAAHLYPPFFIIQDKIGGLKRGPKTKPPKGAWAGETMNGTDGMTIRYRKVLLDIMPEVWPPPHKLPLQKNFFFLPFLRFFAF